MDGRFDYRALEGRAKVIEDKITELTSKEMSDSERDLYNSLMGELHALEQTAGEMKDAEIAELREIAARGVTIGDQPKSDAEKAVEEFKAYLRKGEVGQIMNASLSTTDANGGYIVPEPEHARLIEKVRLNDPVFGRATVFNLTGDTTLLLPYKSAHGVVTTAAEAGARSEQNAPTFTSPSLVCYDYYTDQRATQQVLDSVAGIEEMLMGWIYEDIQEQAGADAVSGNGSTKIKGVFDATSMYTTQFSGSAATIPNTGPAKLYWGVPVKYRAGSAWMCASATLATLAGLALPSNANIPLVTNVGDKWFMYGKEVLESDSAPALGAGNYALGFGDIKAGYAVGIHRDTTILRDPFTAVPKVRFYGLARLGGCPWDYQAIQIMRCATV